MVNLKGRGRKQLLITPRHCVRFWLEESEENHGSITHYCQLWKELWTQDLWKNRQQC